MQKIEMRHLTVAHMPMPMNIAAYFCGDWDKRVLSTDCRLSQEPDGIGDADQPDCSLIVTQLTTARH